MAKSVRGTGQEALEGLGKLIYVKANEVDLVKMVVCTTALEPRTDPAESAGLDRCLCSGLACGGREQRRGGATEVAAPCAPAAVRGADRGPRLRHFTKMPQDRPAPAPKDNRD